MLVIVSLEVAVANSIPGDEAEESARKLVEQFQKENPGLEQYVIVYRE